MALIGTNTLQLPIIFSTLRWYLLWPAASISSLMLEKCFIWISWLNFDRKCTSFCVGLCCICLQNNNEQRLQLYGDNMEMAERIRPLSVQMMSVIRLLDWLDILLACRWYHLSLFAGCWNKQIQMKQTCYQCLIIISADFIPEPSLHTTVSSGCSRRKRVIRLCLVAAEPPHYFVVSRWT